jgi:hypothetical protein
MNRTTLALLLCFTNVALAADPSTPAPAEPPAEAQAAAEAPAEAEPAKKAAAQAEAATKAAPRDEEEDRVVCRTERSVGTRFEKKTCRRQSVWTQIEKRAEEDFGKVRNRPVTCPDCRD